MNEICNKKIKLLKKKRKKSFALNSMLKNVFNAHLLWTFTYYAHYAYLSFQIITNESTRT